MLITITRRPTWPWWIAAAAATACVLAIFALPDARDAGVVAPDDAPRTPLPAAPVATVPAPAPKAAVAPRLHLVGTTVTGADRFAIARRADDRRLIELRVGDRIDDAVVTRIEPGRIELVADGLGTPIAVVPDGAAPTPVTASAAPAAPALPPPTHYVEPEIVVEGH